MSKSTLTYSYFNKYDNEKRTLYYWSKQYSGQLEEGQSYKTLKKCVAINILNFAILPNDRYHNVFVSPAGRSQRPDLDRRHGDPLSGARQAGRTSDSRGEWFGELAVVPKERTQNQLGGAENE